MHVKKLLNLFQMNFDTFDSRYNRCTIVTLKRVVEKRVDNTIRFFQAP